MKRSMSAVVRSLACMLAIVVAAGPGFSHCEIPCGIYDDTMRISMIRENIALLEGAMRTIESFAAHEEHSDNQMVRWVMNKESHATALQHIVTQYFMTQRVKELRNLVDRFEASYFGTAAEPAEAGDQ